MRGPACQVNRSDGQTNRVIISYCALQRPLLSWFVQWFGVGLVIASSTPGRGALSSQLGQLSLPSFRGR